MAIKHKDLKKVVSELEGAVKAHGRQAKTIKQHIKDMGSGPFKMKSPLKGKKGMWANIHAKRKRGEAPAKPGDPDRPSKKEWNKNTK
tara:strand:- start:1663 stop:1923 length:261 start_codon:yes stop_codon:yes gene_type:complete